MLVLGSNHVVFNCPWKPRYFWTNNATKAPPLNIIPNQTGFTYGYNDWGVGESGRNAQRATLGLGSHLGLSDPQLRPIKETEVLAPSDMIAITDTKSDNNWDTVTDPSDPGTFNNPGGEWPSRRHSLGSKCFSPMPTWSFGSKCAWWHATKTSAGNGTTTTSLTEKRGEQNQVTRPLARS
jgi:hypothetical protein